MTDRKELKRLAREAIRDTEPSPLWVTLFVVAVLAVTQLLSLNLNGELDAYITMAQNAAAGEFALPASTESISPLAWLLTLALDLMTMVISMGYTLYALRVSRRASPGFGDIFDAFGMFFRVIVLTIVRSVLLSVVSAVYAGPASMLGLVMDPAVASLICLPLMAPMVILMYAYRLADYILLDNPTFAAVQCLSLSRLAMKGRKWDMFKLDLSFIGWILLCLFPPMLLWVRPYMSVTVAEYYDRVMPDFTEWLKNRPMPRYPNDRGPGFWSSGGDSRMDNPGGWSVPGEKPEETPEEDENDDSGDTT